MGVGGWWRRPNGMTEQKLALVKEAMRPGSSVAAFAGWSVIG